MVGSVLSILQMRKRGLRGITFWQIDGEKEERVADFIFLGSRITEDSAFSCEIHRCLRLSAVSDSQERSKAGVLEHSWHMRRGRGAMEQAQTQNERHKMAFPQPHPWQVCGAGGASPPCSPHQEWRPPCNHMATGLGCGLVRAFGTSANA